MADVIQLERRGVPSVAICTDAQRASADAMAKIQGIAGYRYAVVPHPVSSLDAAGLREHARTAAPQVLEILRGDGPAAGGPPSTAAQDRPTREDHSDAADSRGAGGLVDEIEECFERNWTDGLPVVPPEPALVQRFLAHTDRAPSELILYLSHVRRGCTVEQAAINAVMAGCRPEYFPVVLAAFEACIDKGWPAMGGWQSTGAEPLLIVNGPIRGELGFNSTGNVFGSGFRANSTVGRAIRLIIMNVYGIRPHDLDLSPQGTPTKFGMCIGENEEDSPWEPLHVELGRPAEANTVSALHVRSYEYIDNRNTTEPERILDDIADTITRTGSMIDRPGKHIGVIFGPEHAQLLSRGGYSKQRVKDYLATHASRPAWMFRRAGKDSIAIRDGRELADDEPVAPLASPDDVLVAVAGAANAGVSMVLQTLGPKMSCHDIPRG